MRPLNERTAQQAKVEVILVKINVNGVSYLLTLRIRGYLSLVIDVLMKIFSWARGLMEKRMGEFLEEPTYAGCR